MSEPTITPAMAQMLLDAREAYFKKDHDEVYHQMRMFAAELSDDPYESWKGLAAIARNQS